MSVQQAFDPIAYKKTTRNQWETAAEPWHRWGDLLTRWLGPATDSMLDMAGIGAGSRVLDVAAGAGDQSIIVGRRVGPEGRVLATDISPRILDYAAERVRQEGLENIDTRELDGECLDELPAGSFDAVISRVGMIYFPDQQKALAGMRQALKDGGRVAAMVYSTADRNEFFSIPVSIIRRRANLPAPAPGQPGPFSLGGDGVLGEVLERAGFKDVEVEVIEAPVRLESAAECVRFERESFGALHQMLSGLDAASQEEAWEEIAESLGRFETTDEGFVGPCELIVASGVK